MWELIRGTPLQPPNQSRNYCCRKAHSQLTDLGQTRNAVINLSCQKLNVHYKLIKKGEMLCTHYIRNCTMSLCCFGFIVKGVWLL